MVYTDGGWQNLDSPNAGIDGSPTADASSAIKKQAAALRQGWDREYWSVLQGEKPAAYDLARGTRTLLGSMTGYDATNAARASFAQGNYGTGAVQLVQGFVEAGSTAFGVGVVGGASTGLRMGGMSAGELAAVRATYVETKLGGPSFAAPGVDFATVAIEGKGVVKVYPQTYSQLYHGTDNATLGLPSSMSTNETAQQLYANGLPARGTNIDLIEHVINNAPDRAFRGTTTTAISQERNAGAAYWAGEGGLVIEMKGARGYDVNAALEGRVMHNGRYGDNPKFGEQEIAVPGVISPGMISRVGVPVVKPNGQLGIDWLPRNK